MAVTGDAKAVSLQKGTRTVKLPGTVPAGEWTLLASFGGEPARAVGQVTIPEGGAVSIACSSSFELCKVEK